MGPLSHADTLYLRLLIDAYACELANHAIQSEHVRYPSSTEAMLAMVTEAFLKGRASAVPPDFDADVAAVVANATP